MDFEWDEVKSAKNFRERGLGFDAAALIFLGPTVETVDDRRPYGEVRVKAIGVVEGLFLVVVFTDRPDARRIISARKANRKEREQWRSFVNHLNS